MIQTIIPIVSHFSSNITVFFAKNFLNASLSVGIVYEFSQFATPQQASPNSPITPKFKPIITKADTLEAIKVPVQKGKSTQPSKDDSLESLQMLASKDLLSKLDSFMIDGEDIPLDEGSPEKYYNLIKVNPSLPVLTDLNEKLQKCEEDWLSDFITLGGLELLTETLTLQTRKKSVDPLDIEVNVQIVECITLLLNEQVGLNEAMEVKGFFDTVAMSLDNDSVQVQNTVLKILATGCCFGTEGHSKVLHAFEMYKEKHRERRRFTNLVFMLQLDNLEVKVNVMALINAVVNIPKKISERLDLRKEFLDLGVKELASAMKVIGSEDLDQQLNLFLEEMEDDQLDVQVENVGFFFLFNNSSFFIECEKKTGGHLRSGGSCRIDQESTRAN